jgi:conjugal transfer pilus assembly protein TraB
MIPVQLVSGIDAPARSGGVGLGGVSSTPYPVLMVVEDLAFLPNDYRLNLKECFVLGEGVGELASERAQIRVLGLSCIRESGQATDIHLKGVVTGEDGKLGLRGRVVMREGDLLYRSLLAGFVSGISRAFLPFQQGFFFAQSPQQLLQFPDPQLIGISGLAGGLGRAAEILARFYLAMARSIFPVIEIDAGRHGVLLVTEGKELPDVPL